MIVVASARPAPLDSSEPFLSTRLARVAKAPQQSECFIALVADRQILVVAMSDHAGTTQPDDLDSLDVGIARRP